MKKTTSTTAFILFASVFMFTASGCKTSDDSYTSNNRQSTNISANSQTNPTNSANNTSSPGMNTSAPSNASNR